MNKLIISLFSFGFGFYSLFAQNTEYFKVEEMKATPISLNTLGSFEEVKSYFEGFSFDEKLYSSLFYQGYVLETGKQSKFIKFNLITSKKIVLTPHYFPNYKLILNPHVKKGYLSKQRVGVNMRMDAVTTDYGTSEIQFVFPKNTLQTLEGDPAKVNFKIEGFQYNNKAALNSAKPGFSIDKILDFKIDPTVIPNSFIKFTNTERGQVNLINNRKSDKTLFDDNRIFDFVNEYQKLNGLKYGMKAAGQYKTAIQFKNMNGTVTFQKAINYENVEVYFFENMITGVLTFSTKQKKKLLKQVNSIYNVSNAADLKLDKNGDFPTFYYSYKNTYFKIQQDFNSIKMYFIISK